MMHSSNVTVRQIIRQKFVSPTSTIADNYRYLCSKYNIAHEDWYRDVNHVIKFIVRTKYTNHEYVMSNTISELCAMRDGVAHCDYVNRSDISTLIDMLFVLTN